VKINRHVFINRIAQHLDRIIHVAWFCNESGGSFTQSVFNFGQVTAGRINDQRYCGQHRRFLYLHKALIILIAGHILIQEYDVGSNIFLDHKEIQKISGRKEIVDQCQKLDLFYRIEKKQVIIHVIIRKGNSKKTFIHTTILYSVGEFEKKRAIHLKLSFYLHFIAMNKYNATI